MTKTYAANWNSLSTHPHPQWFKEDYCKEFLAYYYNKAEEWGKEVAVTFKTMKGCMHLPPMAGYRIVTPRTAWSSRCRKRCLATMRCP